MQQHDRLARTADRHGQPHSVGLDVLNGEPHGRHKLEEAKLVSRKPDPADRRQRQVVITAAGTRALARMRRELGKAEERVLSPLTPEQASTFRELLETVARGLNQ